MARNTAQHDLFHATVSSADTKKLLRLATSPNIISGSHPSIESVGKSKYLIYIVAEKRTLDALAKQRGLQVKLGKNQSEIMRTVRKNLPKTSRYKGDKLQPRGFGIKIPSTTNNE